MTQPQHLLKEIKPAPVHRLTRPFLNFMRVEASGGIVLFSCLVIALLLANSVWSQSYEAFWKTPVALQFGEFRLVNSLAHWVNDGLMTLFFFVVGLEIKRELVEGELKDRRAAMLPVMAALGGMAVPAAIYLTTLTDSAGNSGWAIPMATDIAFVVGFLSLLGKRVPKGLKIFLLSLAIVDDIGAVLVIALFYSSNISFIALLIGFTGFLLTATLNRAGVRQVPIYMFIGVLIWLAFLYSGVHPTVSGVLLGLLTPASAWIGGTTFLDVMRKWHDRKTASDTPRMENAEISQLIETTRESVSPLERLEYALHPWVAYFIMPVFALANAGVLISFDSIFSPISVSVALALFLGKPLGILLASWCAVKVFRCHLPFGSNWLNICGCGFLAGIGFTMSIFIAGLALDANHLAAGKVGTLLGSLLSLTIGLGILYFTLPKNPVQPTMD